MMATKQKRLNNGKKTKVTCECCGKTSKQGLIHKDCSVTYLLSHGFIVVDTQFKRSFRRFIDAD